MPEQQPRPRRRAGADERARRRDGSRVVASAVVALAALLAATPLLAAPTPGPDPDSARTAAVRAAPPGFLFGRPRAFVGLRVGMHFPRAGSDIYDFTTNQLTLNRSDFDAVALGGDLGYEIASWADAVLSVDMSRVTRRSEYRDLVEDNDQPIQQETRVTRVPVTASVRLYPFPTGREIGRYAWIPASVVPYVGGGGGMIHYQFKQWGDFVDYTDNTIFTDDDISSGGWTPTGHIFAGLNVRLTPRISLSGEGRYTWASGHPSASSDFGGFAIDLSGFQTTLGMNVRF